MEKMRTRLGTGEKSIEQEGNFYMKKVKDAFVKTVAKFEKTECIYMKDCAATLSGVGTILISYIHIHILIV